MIAADPKEAHNQKIYQHLQQQQIQLQQQQQSQMSNGNMSGMKIKDNKLMHETIYQPNQQVLIHQQQHPQQLQQQHQHQHQHPQQIQLQQQQQHHQHQQQIHQQQQQMQLKMENSIQIPKQQQQQNQHKMQPSQPFNPKQNNIPPEAWISDCCLLNHNDYFNIDAYHSKILERSLTTGNELKFLKNKHTQLKTDNKKTSHLVKSLKHDLDKKHAHMAELTQSHHGMKNQLNMFKSLVHACSVNSNQTNNNQSSSIDSGSNKPSSSTLPASSSATPSSMSESSGGSSGSVVAPGSIQQQTPIVYLTNAPQVFKPNNQQIFVINQQQQQHQQPMNNYQQGQMPQQPPQQQQQYGQYQQQYQQFSAVQGQNQTFANIKGVQHAEVYNNGSNGFQPQLIVQDVLFNGDQHQQQQQVGGKIYMQNGSQMINNTQLVELNMSNMQTINGISVTTAASS